MLGIGKSMADATDRWLERKDNRARAQGKAQGLAEVSVRRKVLRVLDVIDEATPGSSYRIELEDYLDRMLTAFSNGEKFDESMPEPGDLP